MAHHHARRPHHPRHSCRNDQLCSYCSSGCCCCSSSFCRLGLAESTAGDPLVEALAAQLIQASRSHLYSTFTKSHISHNPPQTPTFHQEHHQHQTHALLSSLLRRIDALESSLLHFSSTPTPSPSSYSLRHAAARTIQTHFRAFLVRRSRTLAHLKHLALIKSAFNSLRSSLSHQTHFDFEALSHNAMDLLLKLDSIQDNDSMIRDGKRSVTRELVQFLDFIDGVSARSHRLRNKPSRNMRTGQNASKFRVFPGRVDSNYRDSGADRRELMEKLRDRVEKIRGFSRVLEKGEEDVELEGFQHLSDDEENPSISIIGKGGVSEARKGILVKRQELQPKVRKSVSFAENRNLFSVSRSTHEPDSAEDDPSMTQTELVENLSREIKDMGGLSRGTGDDDGGDTESGGSSQTSDDERNHIRNLGTEDGHEVEHYQYQDGNFVFSAPLPLKMESRTDSTKKIKGIKIIT